MFKINPNDYIKEFEDKIQPFLRENGMVDGLFLARMLKTWKPSLAKIIEVPENDFRLSDFVEDMAKILKIGGRW